MNTRLLRVAALVLAVIVALGAMYGGRFLAWRNSREGQSTAHLSTRQRKVLYYYDAMNPQHHYDRPGKAPDGMDLVPQYADDNATGTTRSSAQSATPGGRKIPRWPELLRIAGDRGFFPAGIHP